MSSFHQRSANSNIVIVEYSWTRDRVIDLADGSWATMPVRPWGPGWIVVDAHRDRHTKWRRIRRWGER
jgi:hypothetical protein